jgi:hypothetical protein
MNIPWDSINGFAGATGIGAICVLGFFFIADGQDSNILHTLNTYAKTASWSILAAVPTVAISFLVGQFAILSAAFLCSFFTSGNFSEVTSLISISKANNEFLSQEYLRIKQEKDILCGSSFSFLILGVGAFFELRNLSSHKRVILISAFISLLTGVALFVLGIQRLNLLNQLINTVLSNIDLLKK